MIMSASNEQLASDTLPTPDTSNGKTAASKSGKAGSQNRPDRTTKERNVIKMVNYEEIYQNEHWKQNKVSEKLRQILFVLYVHDNEVNAWDWKVVTVFLWSPSLAQENMLQADYGTGTLGCLVGFWLVLAWLSFGFLAVWGQYFRAIIIILCRGSGCTSSDQSVH